MGSYPALSIRPPQDPTQGIMEALRIRALLKGQQLSDVELKQHQLQNQQTQMTVQGQQQLRAAEQDPEWDPTDLDKSLRVMHKYSVPTDVAKNVISGISQIREGLSKASTEQIAAIQNTHGYMDDQFQAVKAAPDDQKQNTYAQGIQNVKKHVAMLPPGPARDQMVQELQNVPALYDPIWVNEQHASLRSMQYLTEESLKTAQAREATSKAGQAEAETKKAGAQTTQVQAETANLPTPQQAAAQRTATLQKTQTETAKTAEELRQLRQTQQGISTPDVTGFKSTLAVPEYNKRYDAFSGSKGMQQLQTLQGSYGQFQDVLSDLDAGKPMTGAASVVALFNAIGISAEPLAGKGFRINSNTIQEHVGARGLDQAAYQKVLSLKQGDIITPQQVRDYASIASNVYKNAYVNAADEAHRRGLPADFLPQGGGNKLDSTTAEIYARAVLHANPQLAKRPSFLKAAVSFAAAKNGWDVGQ
jgi:hypothetical protein